MSGTPTIANKTCDQAEPIKRLKKRVDFLAAARAFSWATRSLVLQANKRGDEDTPRIGFTVTKKVGNAVVRNKVKRRLREAVRLTMPEHACPGYDYVVIGRKSTIDAEFDSLKSDLALAAGKVHKGAHRERKTAARK